jgi:hypothetical protein
MTMVIALAGLSGCGAGYGPQNGSSSATQTRSEMAGLRDMQGPVYLVAQYDVENVQIDVPQSLVVSEANSYRPRADIVWHGDPIGDRHAQVAAILAEAMATGTVMMTEGRKVDVQITLTRFHCLTDRTRRSIGGMHAMQFDLTVRDAETGVILDGPRPVVADIRAAGGAKARAEDAAGRTQRVVVVERLAEVIRFQLSKEVAGPVAPMALVTAN